MVTMMSSYKVSNWKLQNVDDNASHVLCLIIDELVKITRDEVL